MSVSIPDFLARFRAYHASHPTWGALHIVLDDGNMSNADVQFCIEYAVQQGDAECAALARVLLSMSKTQRKKLGRMG